MTKGLWRGRIEDERKLEAPLKGEPRTDTLYTLNPPGASTCLYHGCQPRHHGLGGLEHSPGHW